MSQMFIKIYYVPFIMPGSGHQNGDNWSFIYLIFFGSKGEKFQNFKTYMCYVVS